ncbi:MAG: methyltransferase domain-containing protein [Candidatus Liptonbacteria bacterium]|nr:methyltransferase domain-containing protein [Candidatus Liptonbacteria bacterium]
MTYRKFITSVLKDPHIAALSKSSKFVCERVSREIKPGCKYIVEYGAGDGVITKYLLRALPPDGKLVAIEKNKELLSELRRIEDKRLVSLDADVVHVSKNLNALGLPKIHAIISGIPFSFLAPQARRELVERSHRALETGGLMLLYQHSFLMASMLADVFGGVHVSFEPRNFLPYFIMQSTK